MNQAEEHWTKIRFYRWRNEEMSTALIFIGSGPINEPAKAKRGIMFFMRNAKNDLISYILLVNIQHVAEKLHENT